IAVGISESFHVAVPVLGEREAVVQGLARGTGCRADGTELSGNGAMEAEGRELHSLLDEERMIGGFFPDVMHLRKVLHTKTSLPEAPSLDTQPSTVAPKSWFCIPCSGITFSPRLLQEVHLKLCGRGVRNERHAENKEEQHAAVLHGIGHGSERQFSVNLCRRTPDLRILICGLDAAGKTSVLYRLKTGELLCTIPTIGFNVELAGQSSLFGTLRRSRQDRALHRHYYPNSRGVLYIVDGVDRDRLGESVDELNRLCSELDDCELGDIPLALLCNKSDLKPQAPRPANELRKVAASIRRPCRCFEVSAATGAGYQFSAPLSSNPDLRILIWGLDAAGKTSILASLFTIPTIGFNVEAALHRRPANLTVWDIGQGGREKTRALYRHYYSNSRVCCTSVDGVRTRPPWRAVQRAGRLRKLGDIPLALLCNKSDLKPQAVAETCNELAQGGRNRFEGPVAASRSRRLPERSGRKAIDWLIASAAARAAEGAGEGEPA
uniref:ADP-ribosylation factor family protein n=1 Tax=Macrostomum lignano TaxID=282301 RepID=A0A1I8FJM2_9PLAT